MRRLIDADVLIKDISKRPYIDNGLREIFKTIIDEQPTAFDTEKVVEQLMVIHDEGYCPNEDSLECVLDKACSDCYREKIADIVKKGGVE